ncbi:MAG: nucleotide-binding domain-containing protein [Minisyncoccota bacterium]
MARDRLHSDHGCTRSVPRVLASVNTGEHARQEGGLRGTIFEGERKQTERSLYTGVHWIECFIVTHQGVCIARSSPFYVMFLNPQFPLALE